MYCITWLFIAIVAFVSAEREIHDPLGIFCGTENCYNVLGVERTATAQEVKKAYRKHAISSHPDKNLDKADSALDFQRISKAYEVLSGNETRPLFDYYLDHPWDYYKVSGKFVWRNMPKSNAFVVLIVFLSLISGLYYWVQMQNYNKVKAKLLDSVLNNLGPKNGGTAYTEELFDVVVTRYNERTGSKIDKTTKSKMMKSDEFQAIVKQLIDEIEIGGDSKKPTLKDLLIVKLFLLPVTLVQSFTSKKEPEKSN